MIRGPVVAANVALSTLVVATSAGIVAYGDLGSVGRFGTALVAFCSFGALFLPAVRPYALTPRRVMLASGILIVVAVVTPLRASSDLWSYTVYGRMVSVHGASPFTHVPADFPHDRFLHLVGRGWRHTGSVYGPAFVALSAVGTALTGPSLLANRLLFQGLEAVALGIALAIIWRRTRDPRAIAFLGLNPALIAVVNGGHNDLLVGLTLLGGTLLLVDNRPRRAGAVLALGALVKLVLVLPIGALLLWAWHRQRAGAIRAAATTGAILVASYAVAGGTAALGPLLDARMHRSRSSVWQVPVRWLLHPWGIHGSGVASKLSSLALVVVAVVAVVIVLAAISGRLSRFAEPEVNAAVVAGAAALVFLARASYVLPWYSAWCLPLLALAWRSRVATVAAAQAALFALAYAAPLAFGGVFGIYAQGFVPSFSLAALVYLVVSARRGRLADPVAPSRLAGEPPTLDPASAPA